MKEKTGIAIVGMGIAAVLGVSLLFTFMNGDNRGDVVVVVNSNPVHEPETTAVSSKKTEKTTKKTTTAKTTQTSKRTTKLKTTTAKSAKPKKTQTFTAENVYLDINEAAVEEFMKLNGIGEATAMKIAEYREINGRFRNIEEIMLVDGIGEKKFLEIMDSIYVVNPEYDDTEETTAEETTTEEITSEAEGISSDEPEISSEEPDNEQTEEDTSCSEAELSLEDIAPIDLNTAEKEEIMLLPNVTEEIADEIIEFREQSGGFRNVYELMYIEELTQNQLEEILEFVIVSQYQ